MTNRKRSVLEELEYDLTVRYFASAFEACERLPTVDQQLVLKDVAKRVTASPTSRRAPERRSLTMDMTRLAAPLAGDMGAVIYSDICSACSISTKRQ